MCHGERELRAVDSASVILCTMFFGISCDSRSVEDESAEFRFCESHQLNMSTLRMTSEAKVR